MPTPSAVIVIEISHIRTIAAPTPVVWKVIADLDKYPEWNPFVVACKSTLAVGDPIIMRVRLLPGLALVQRESIREYVSEQSMEYGIQLPVGMLRSVRRHVVMAQADNATQYESYFRLSGWLAPVVKVLLNRQLLKGFRAMSDALVARAESLAQATLGISK